MIRYAVFVIGLLGWVSGAVAATGDFTVRALIGDDTTPPTTPSIISATPLATTQIDVVWSAATDDLSLAGYKLFRDGTQIATTTLTSYSDTGLVPSTTYTYIVQAFDSFRNVSSSSAPVATTTLAEVVISTSTPTTSNEVAATGRLRSSSGRVDLESFLITPETRRVIVDFTTRIPSRFSLRWGRTSIYDDGYIVNDVYSFSHRTVITDLEPGTVYEYELVGYNDFGQPYELKTGRFTTTEIPDAVAPVNVSNLRAVVEGQSVRLLWQRPPDEDFAGVRIIRNPFFYPVDSQDGFLVFQGDAETVVDIGALVDYSTQYYTVFSYDSSGNLSSGAVVNVVWTPSAGGDGPTILPLAPSSVPPPATTTPMVPHIKAEYERLSLRDVTLYQDNNMWHLDDHAITLRTAQPVRVSVPYEAVPPHLKSIVLDVAVPGHVPQSYLLRINREQTAYEAVIPPLQEAGIITLQLYVFDHLLRIGQELVTSATVVAGTARGAAAPLFPDRIVWWLVHWGWIVAGALLLVVAFRYRARSK